MPAGRSKSDQPERGRPPGSCSILSRMLAAALSVTRTRAPPFSEPREKGVPFVSGEKWPGETVEIEICSGLGTGPGDGLGNGSEVGGVGSGTGSCSRVTTTDCWAVPNALVQLTEIELLPSVSEYGLFWVLLELRSPILHVVPGGIAELPSTVKATDVDDDVVLEPSCGLVIATDGPSPRVMLID